MERRQHRDAWTDTIDSQASSTQTAHSWVHGGAPIRESVVRPTRSFEYLPGMRTQALIPDTTDYPNINFIAPYYLIYRVRQLKCKMC